MIAVVATIIAVLVALPSIYLGALGLLASLPQQRPTRTSGAPRKFAVIVPAHNEAARIGDSLESLARQSYPPEKYQVIVVADNCTDDTAAIARARGAKVVERHDIATAAKATRWPLGSSTWKLMQGLCCSSMGIARSARTR